MQECLNTLRSDVRYFIVREFISPYMDVLVPGKRNGFRPHVGRDEFFAIIVEAEKNRQRRLQLPSERNSGSSSNNNNNHKKPEKNTPFSKGGGGKQTEGGAAADEGTEKVPPTDAEATTRKGPGTLPHTHCAQEPEPPSPQEKERQRAVERHRHDVWRLLLMVLKEKLESAGKGGGSSLPSAAGSSNLRKPTTNVDILNVGDAKIAAAMEGAVVSSSSRSLVSSISSFDEQQNIRTTTTTKTSTVATAAISGSMPPPPPPPPPGHILFSDLHWLLLLDYSGLVANNVLRRVLHALADYSEATQHHTVIDRVQYYVSLMEVHRACRRPISKEQALLLMVSCQRDAELRHVVFQFVQNIIDVDKHEKASEQQRLISQNRKGNNHQKQQKMKKQTNYNNKEAAVFVKELPENIDSICDVQKELYLRTLRRRSSFGLACELNKLMIRQRNLQRAAAGTSVSVSSANSGSDVTDNTRSRSEKQKQQYQDKPQPNENKKGKWLKKHQQQAPTTGNNKALLPSVSEEKASSATTAAAISDADDTVGGATIMFKMNSTSTINKDSPFVPHSSPPQPSPVELLPPEECPPVSPVLFPADHPCVFLIKLWHHRDITAVEHVLRGGAMPRAHHANPAALKQNQTSNEDGNAKKTDEDDDSNAKRESDASESEPDDAPDYESMILCMFPEPTTDVSIAHKVITLSAAKPVDNSFITDFCQYKYKQARDMHDMLAYIPLVILFLILVYSGRGLRPAAYDGHGIYHATVVAIDHASFPVCNFNENGTIACSATETATLADVNSVSSLHSMLNGFIPSLLWPTANASAGGTFVGNRLKPVGALKIRQLRVGREEGKPSDFWGVRYLESVTTDYSGGTAPDSVLALPKFPPFSIDGINKDRHATLSGLSEVADVVLPPFDGGSFFSCEALNASSTSMGGDRTFPCSGHAIVVPFNRTREEFEGLAAAISNNGWIDLQSRRLFIEYFLFHKSIGMFVSVRHIFEIRAGGHVLTTTTTSPFFFADKASQGTTEFFILGLFIGYGALLILHCILFRTGLVSLTRSVTSLSTSEKKEKKQWTPEAASEGKPIGKQILESLSFGNTWRMMDLVNLICFLVSIGLRVGLWLPKGAPVDPVWQLQYFPRHYDEAFVSFETVAIADAVCVVFTILSLFRFTKYFPSFDAVANTLSLSVGPGLALLLLTLGCVVGFAICATIIYGDVYYEVRSVDIAILTSLSSFWSNHDYRAYIPFQPIVSYLYVLNYNFIFVAFFVNAIVAVFSDAFSEVQESTFRPDTIEAILNNNPHHLLQKSGIKRRFEGSPLVLLAKAAIEQLKKLCQSYSDEDRYTYDAYYRRLMFDILSLFQPEVFGKMVAYPHPDDRAEVCSELVRLCEVYFRVPTTTQPREVRGQKEIATIMEYARGLFRNPLDFTLVMVLYVFVPQKKFKQSGIDMLYDAARAHKKWMTDVEAKTVHVSKEDVKDFQLRVRNETEKRDAIIAKQRQHLAFAWKKEYLLAVQEDGNQTEAGMTPFGSSMLQQLSSVNSVEELNMLEAAAAATGRNDSEHEEEQRNKKRAHEALTLVDSMNYLHRRFFFSVIASAQWSHFSDEATLTEERFVDICESIENFPLAYDAYMGPADAYRRLHIDVWKSQNEVEDIFMIHLLPLAQDSFAVRCFGFEFTMGDVFRMDKAIRNMATMDLQFQLRVNKSKGAFEMTAEEAMEVAAGKSIFLKKDTRQPSSPLPPRTTRTDSSNREAPATNEIAVPTVDGEEQARDLTAAAEEDTEDDVGETKGQGQQVSIEVLPDVAAAMEADADDEEFFDERDFPEDAYSLTENEFRSVWRSAKGSYPSDAVTKRVFSIFPDGRLDAKLFLYFSRANTLSHQYHAFHVDFARWMDQYSRFAFWALFYVPFMILVVFSALYGYDHSEVVHISLSLTNDFQLKAPNSAEDVTKWLTDTVIDKVWSQSHLPPAAWIPSNTSGGVSDVFRPSPLLNAHAGVNYMVGALRIRQQRVGKASGGYCKTILGEFFGDDVPSKGLRFPAGISGNAAIEAFYNARVQQDFGEDFLKGSCHISFNYGETFRENAIDLPDANATAAAIGAGKTVDRRVQAAFDFKASSVGSRCEAHDATYFPGGYILDIPFANTSVDAAKALMKEALALGWLDDTSRFLVAEFVSYNPNLLVYTHSRFGVEITAGGAYYPIAFTRSMDGEPNPIWLTAILSFLLLGLLVIYLVLIVTTLHTVFSDKRPSFSAGLRMIVDTIFLYPWFFMDVIIVCLLLIPWAWRLYLSNEVIISAIHNFGLYPAHVEERCYVIADIIRVIEGTTILIIFIRSSNHLSVFRNLAIISQTIALALKDLVSISVFFAVSLIAFAITAQLLFGYQVNAYASFPLAFLDLFLVSFGSDSIYGDIYPVRPVVAPIYQIAFTTVCNIIFYNMITAILTGALGEVKSTVFDSTRAKSSILESWKDQTRARRGQQGITAIRLNTLFSLLTDPETKNRRNRLQHEQRLRANTLWNTLRRAVIYTFRTTSLLQEIAHVFDVLFAALCCCCAGRGQRTDQVHPASDDNKEDANDAKSAKKKKPRDGPLPPKLCAKLYSFRTVWGSLSEWWSMLDTGLPQEAAIAGMKILIVAQEVSDDQERRKRLRVAQQMEVFYRALDDGGEGDEANKYNAASPTNQHQPPTGRKSLDSEQRAAMRLRFKEDANLILGEVLGEKTTATTENRSTKKLPTGAKAGNALTPTVAPPWWAPRMSTFGRRRRLPIWNELLFSKFETEFPNLAFHLITVPLYLTMFPGVRTHHDDNDNEKDTHSGDAPLDDDEIWDNLVQYEESYLWLTALEVKHYFDLEREKYTVELGGENEDASDD